MLQENVSQTSTAQVSARANWLDRPLNLAVRVNWETVAWVGLLTLAFVTRFYGLGARVMSHDESLHAVFSYDLYSKGTYQHNPMMHGPLLFHINAFFYFLFGVTDATTRLGPALAGVAVVGMAWAFRRWIGRTGALLAGLFLLISPSLLFHSRYIRNDIYVALFSMIWIYGMFRYLAERELRWLYLMVIGMAFGFITKENQFMSGAIFGSFLVGLTLWRMVSDREPLNRSVFADVSVLMLTLILPFTAPFGYLLGTRLAGWQTVDWNGVVITNQLIGRFAFLIAFVTLLSIGIAYYWFAVVRKGPASERITFGTWAGLMLVFWTVEIVFFTTFFTNPVNGLATGIVGSLGYWIAQQAVERGSQPWYYYILETLLYEFLPLILSISALAVIVRGLLGQQWEPTPLAELPIDVPTGDGGGSSTEQRQQPGGAKEADQVDPRRMRIYFVLFLAWWTLAAWGAYSYAGEKMPWLLTHIAQPMTILGGWWMGRLIHRVDWSAVRRSRAFWLIAVFPALVFAIALLLTARPFQGRDLNSLGRTMRWIFGLLVTGGLLYLSWHWIQQSGWMTALRLLAIGAVTVLFLLTVRFSYMLTYVNYDSATEYLVYAHGAPDVKRAINEIKTISQRTVGDQEIAVAYDDDTAWPMSWYMRFFPNNIYYGDNPNTNAMSAPVILVGSKNYAKVEPYVARDYVSRTYRLIWWPEESYKGPLDAEGRPQGLSLGQIWGALTDPQRRSRLWQIWFYRRHPDQEITAWPHRHEFRMYVRRDIAEIVWDLNVTPTSFESAEAAQFDYETIDLSATTVYSGVYGGTPLLQPRAVAVGPDGERVIADTGNNRIVVLDNEGTFVRAFGSTCFLSDGEAGGCVDPDGSGPLQLGDGQFREPWGVTVDSDGNIYVSDTWNGRIQIFDSAGNFLNKWGTFAVTESENGDPYWLFGPRGIAIGQNGDLLVADTGNKRIVEYTPDGEYVRQIGGGGFILGRFEEPVDLAVDRRSGDIYVADTWNKRIQKLSPELEAVAEWPVPSWDSQDIYDKAYIAVDNNGTVYASDPQFFQIFVYSSAGQLESSFGHFGTGPDQFGKPNDLAVDPTTNTVLVADAGNNRIMVFPAVQ